MMIVADPDVRGWCTVVEEEVAGVEAAASRRRWRRSRGGLSAWETEISMGPCRAR